MSSGSYYEEEMPSGGYRRLTAFIFLVNSHSKKSLFLLTMGLAGRILFRDTIAWLCLSLQKIIINTKTVIPWNITAQTMIITILLHLLVSHQVAFSIGNLSEIGVRKISGTTKLLGATNCLDISPFFYTLIRTFQN